MIVYGIVKSSETRSDGTLWIKVRVPLIHGADDQKMYDGRTIRNYVLDDDLPWYQSIQLPVVPSFGSIVALSTVNDSKNEFIVIGVMRFGGDES